MTQHKRRGPAAHRARQARAQERAHRIPPAESGFYAQADAVFAGFKAAAASLARGLAMGLEAAR